MNILYIFADQLQAFAIHCMDNHQVKTPHLDRLASEGVLFRNCYTCAPTCTPYRGTLFTGRYSSQTGVAENGDKLPLHINLLADELNNGGYKTGYIGKWHLGGTENTGVTPELRGGFQEFVGYQCYNDYLHEVCFFDEDGVKHNYHQHRTDVTTDIAIERLSRMKDSKFALFISYQNPHYPVQPSDSFYEPYKDLDILRRPNVMEIDPYIPTASPKITDRFNDPNYQRYGNNLDEYIRLYYAMITQLDHNVGRIMDHLGNCGLLDNTAIIFTSDHGDMQGSHGLKNKKVFWEESTRVPLIVRMPQGLKGTVREEFISSVDFFPTLLEIGGLPLPKGLEGRSFIGLIQSTSVNWENEIYSENGHWIMLRREEFKLVMDITSDTVTHLFDLEEDPYEMNNLMGLLPQIELRLAEQLRHWRKETLSRSIH
jgi:arylsulfatase A-like enzyme